jgi:OFA family oxalate/formate antiporter-like MFS transporter
MNKWTMALAGTIVMMTLGSIYSWSLFTQPLIAAFGWSNTATTFAFGLAIFSVGIGAVIGGRWQDRVGPRPVTLTGVALWSGGNILMGLGAPTFGAWWMYLTYGVVGGLGVGMAYVTPVATVIKWFRDKRGLAGGIVVMGFGLGAAIYNLIVKSLPSFTAAAAAATDYAKALAAANTTGQAFDGESLLLAPEHVQAVMQVFVESGIVFLIAGGIASWYLTNPPARRDMDQPVPDDELSFSTREMLRTPQFYHLWLMLFVNVTAGILLIGNALPIMQELVDLQPQTAATIFAGVAVFNALGRIFWGTVSDRIGRKAAFALLFGIQAIAFMTIGGLHDTAAVAAAYALVLLCFGGGFGIMPSFCADYFGTRQLGVNYGMLLTAWGAAGLISPAFSALIKDATGSFAGALAPVAVLLMLAIILPLITRKPDAGVSSRGKNIEMQVQ